MHKTWNLIHWKCKSITVYLNFSTLDLQWQLWLLNPSDVLLHQSSSRPVLAYPSTDLARKNSTESRSHRMSCHIPKLVSKKFVDTFIKTLIFVYCNELWKNDFMFWFFFSITATTPLPTPKPTAVAVTPALKPGVTSTISKSVPPTHH